MGWNCFVGNFVLGSCNFNGCWRLMKVTWVKDEKELLKYVEKSLQKHAEKVQKQEEAMEWLNINSVYTDVWKN